MARDLTAYLQDILEACTAIEDVMSGVSQEEYRSRRAVRSAVEREFILIGEALRRISVLDAALFQSISIHARSLIFATSMLTTMAQLMTMPSMGWSIPI